MLGMFGSGLEFPGLGVAFRATLRSRGPLGKQGFSEVSLQGLIRVQGFRRFRARA